MSEQNTKIDGRTKRAADLAIAKRTISRASYDAILAGRIGLVEAKAIGRNGAPAADATDGPGAAAEISRSASAVGGQDRADTPPRPVSRISKDDRTPTKTPCLCGCGTPVVRLFAQGHDARMLRVAREHLAEGRELSDEQREYLESSGKMERVRAKLAEEDARRRTAEVQKTTRKGNQ
jgi:hypothetical protein